MISSENKIKQGQTNIVNAGALLKRSPKNVAADVNGQYIISAEDFFYKYLIFDSGEIIEVVFPEGLIADLKGEIIAVVSNNTELTFTNETANVALTPIQGAELSITGEGVWGSRATEVDSYLVYGTLNPLPEATITRNYNGTALDISDVDGFNYNYAAPSNASTYTISKKESKGIVDAYVKFTQAEIDALANGHPTVTGGTLIGGVGLQADTVYIMRVFSPDGADVNYIFLDKGTKKISDFVIGGTVDVTASRDLAATDNGKTLLITGDNIVLTMVAGLGTDFACNFMMLGTPTGVCQIVAGAGFTLNAPLGDKLLVDYTANLIKKTGAEEGYLRGELTA